MRPSKALTALVLFAMAALGCAAPPETPDASASTATGASRAPSATPAAPSASGDPVRIGQNGEPWILFTWFPSGRTTRGLFLVHPDGSGGHAILQNLAGEHSSGAWSPDGTRLAFAVVDTATPNGSIWTANADGSGATLLTDGRGACPDGLAHPSWSPDGSKLALICYPDPHGKQGSVAVYDPGARSMTRLVTVDWPEHLDSAPSWSPDGRSLAFAILRWDPTDQVIVGSSIAVTSVAGGPESRLTPFDANMTDPDWSPDGLELVAFSYDLGNIHTTTHASNLYLIRPDGTHERQLTFLSVDGNMRVVEPRWSPDGRRILCAVGISRNRNFTTDDLRLAFVNPAGGEPELISPIVDGAEPDLQPTNH